MTVKECYEKMGSDYDGVIQRLMSDKLICKYNKKFAESKDCESLERCLEERDFPEAFRMAHSIKGMCMNLGYQQLFQVSSELCEALRDGEPSFDVTPMLEAVKQEHAAVLACIAEMDVV